MLLICLLHWLMIVYAISTYILILALEINCNYDEGVHNTLHYRPLSWLLSKHEYFVKVRLHLTGIKCKGCVLAVWQADIPALSCRSRWHDTQCRPAKAVILSQYYHTQLLPEGLIVWWAGIDHFALLLNTTPFLLYIWAGDKSPDSRYIRIMRPSPVIPVCSNFS